MDDFEPSTSATPVPRASRKRVLFLAKFLVSASLLYWFVSRTSLDAVLDALSGADLRWVAGGLMLQFLGAALVALRWKMLLAAQAVTPGYRYLLNSTLCSFFFRQFLPSVIGGDALRGHDAWRAGASPGFAVISLFVDRLLGFMSLALFALVALLMFGRAVPELSHVVLPVCVALAVGSVVMGILFVGSHGGTERLARLGRALPAAVAGRLARLATGVRVFGGERAMLVRALLVSMVLQVNVVTFYWMISRALGLQVPFIAFFAIVPIAIFVMMAPITINGIGLRETMFVYLLGLWSVDKSDALAFAWIEFGLLLLIGLIGGIIYQFRRGAIGQRGTPRERVLSPK